MFFSFLRLPAPSYRPTGVESGGGPAVLLRSARQRGPPAVAGARVGEPLQGEEVFLRHSVKKKQKKLKTEKDRHWPALQSA